MATEIWTAQDLDNVRNNLNDDYIQMADIDLSGYNWVPIGKLPGESAYQAFSGNYDGNGFKIINLTIDRPESDCQGLFSSLTMGKVKNVSIVNANIKGRDYVGSLAGLTGVEIIEGCSAVCNVTGDSYIGGLIGDSNYGSIAYCYTIGSVIGSGEQYVGGLVGSNFRQSIVSCYSSCAVNGNGHSTGGLIGFCFASTIECCYSIGHIVGKLAPTGGMIGNRLSGEIVSSYWDVETSGQAVSAGGDGKTTAEMKKRETFVGAGWDFNNVWIIKENINGGYPQLRRFCYLPRIIEEPVPYEIIFGPVGFGLSYLKKRIRKVKLVVSKEKEATIFISTSNADVGCFTDEIEIAADAELDMKEISLPVAAGDPSGGLSYRVRVRGSGYAEVHEISFEVSPRRI